MPNEKTNYFDIETSSQNSLLLLPIKELSQKRFVIGSYQRGYKWGKKEILELLNDINSFDESQSIYCLQPLILNSSDNEFFEIIDGQQRTTTIYIILNYLCFKGLISKDKLYRLDYNTRTRSGKFLKENLDLIFNFSLSKITKKELDDKEYQNVKSVNELWQNFIFLHPDKDFNFIDVYHFFTVASYAVRWMEEELGDDQSRNRFIDILLNKVNLIWYQLDNDDSGNVIKVFLNNNKGKISLTSSELIKALFILSIKNLESKSISELKTNQFALEWDSIEKQLQDDKFWFFIQSDETLYADGTRIDYLFDLHFKRDMKSKDLFYSYRNVEKIFNDEPNNLVKDIWESIVQLYYKLMNWYQDQTLYHLVGYLINAKIKTLKKIIELSTKKDKLTFQKELNKVIKNEFSTRIDKGDPNSLFKYELANLHYEENYYATKKVLLLYNVLYYVGNKALFKFPFDLYTKNNWSIEHIIPQNPKEIEEKDVLLQWITDLYAYNGEVIDQSLIDMIKNQTSMKEVKNNKSIQTKINELILKNADLTHAISNLLLLDKNTNSSLGNSLFKDKRNRILEFDRIGQNDHGKPIFIPVETLNAFNKTFSSTINIENWTKEDGEAYENSIADRLNDFLPN